MKPQFSAEDRETIVLGGLIQEDVTSSGSKVPLLGSIPVLGNLFKTRSKSNDRTNLLVFLKPTVLKSKEDALNATRDKFEDIWEIEITSEGNSIDELFKGIPPK